MQKKIINPLFENIKISMEKAAYDKEVEKYKEAYKMERIDEVVELVTYKDNGIYSKILVKHEGEKGIKSYETNMPVNYWFNKDNQKIKLEATLVKGGGTNNTDMLIVLRGEIAECHIFAPNNEVLSDEEYKKYERLFGSISADKKKALYSMVCISKERGKNIPEAEAIETSIRFKSEEELKAAYEVMKSWIPADVRYEIERCFEDLKTGDSDERKIAKKVLIYLLNFEWIYEEKVYDVNSIMTKLDETHVGMQVVKDTFKKLLISCNNSVDKVPEIICLTGREACGKTSIAEAFFKAMGKDYSKFSISGKTDVRIISGTLRCYDNGKPSTIMSNYLSKTPDAGFIFDDIDKASSKCVDALAAFLDRDFNDEFIEVHMDLSKLFIICTANDVMDIDPALLSRMTVVNIEEYTLEEKIDIIRKIFIPRMCKTYDIDQGKQNFSIEVCEKIINEYAGGESMATIERIVNDIFVKGLELNQRFPDINLENFNDYYSVDDEKKIMMNVYARDFGTLRRKIQVCNSLYPKSVQKKNAQMIDSIIHGSADNKEYALNVLRVTGNILKGRDINIDISRIKAELDATHFGMNKCKEAIENYFVDMLISGNKKSKAILLDGPAGGGKTSIAKSIANALGLKYKKISVNGVSNAESIKGFRRTFKGSTPGKIAMAMADEQICSCSLVLLVDEIDKMCTKGESDPYTAFYDLLDNQGGFYDEYLEMFIPTERVLFIFSSNDISKIPETLVDRMEVIKLDGYSCYEKKIIARSYVMPKVAENYKLKDINISDETLSLLVKDYCVSLGVRDLELAIENLVKTNIKEAMLQGRYRDDIVLDITEKDIKKVLGSKHNNEDMENAYSDKLYGKARALAVAGSRGITFDIQMTDNKYGKNDKETGLATGSFRESIDVAKTVVCKKLEREMPDNIHIHAMNAGIEKDGPSAGITLYACMMSYMLKKPIGNCGFTGEIDLFGQIKRIGGLKAKLAAAERAGVERVFIPRENYEDIVSEKDTVYKAIEIIPISHVNELDEILFTTNEY